MALSFVQSKACQAQTRAMSAVERLTVVFSVQDDILDKHRLEEAKRNLLEALGSIETALHSLNAKSDEAA